MFLIEINGNITIKVEDIAIMQWIFFSSLQVALVSRIYAKQTFNVWHLWSLITLDKTLKLFSPYHIEEKRLITDLTL